MFAYIINLFWIISSIVLAVALALAVLIFALALAYNSAKELEDEQSPAPVPHEPSQRKYRRPYFQNHVA